MEQQSIPWEAISARLKNNANDEQMKQIQDWLDSSPEHPMILSEIMNTWSITKHISEFYQPDMTINWQKLMKRINYQPRKKTIRSIFLRLTVAAAVLVLVFMAGIGWSDRSQQPSAKVTFTKIIAPEGNKTQIVLPDSTYVWLNSGSTLEYSSNYTSQNREVQ